MKNVRALVMLALSLIIGLGVAVYAGNYVSQKSAVASNKIVVANIDIQLGSKLNSQMLTTVEYPSGNVPSGAFNDITKLQDRVVKTGISRDEPILEAKLAPAGTQGGLSAVISEGKRAITVKGSEIIAVAGFVNPGNYVDIIVNTQKDDNAKNPSKENREISKIFLSHVLVLAAAQEAGRDETKPKIVNAITLEVTPEESEKIDLARSIGTISLTLRNQTDVIEAKTVGITKEELLELKEKEVVKPVAAAPKKVVKAVKRVSVAAPAEKSVCVQVIKDNASSHSCF